VTLSPKRFCASKKILGSLALLTFLFGISTPNEWTQQSAKAAAADRPASPSDPAAAPETAAAVLERISNSGLQNAEPTTAKGTSARSHFQYRNSATNQRNPSDNKTRDERLRETLFPTNYAHSGRFVDVDNWIGEKL
jgi:hypothetical protein